MRYDPIAMFKGMMSGMRLFLLLTCVGIGMLGVLQCSVTDAEADRSIENIALADPEMVSDFPVPTPTRENTSLADKSSQYLCDHLVDLKEMPFKVDRSDDAVYDALMRKGEDAFPCLIEKITDTQPATNPTGAPFWAGLTYRVGDTAVLMLMRMNDMYWPKGMLAKKYEDMFPSEGMFAYYFYVDEVPGARKAIQRWWRTWLKTCKPTCAKVETIE